jgi:hypothetical protein
MSKKASLSLVLALSAILSLAEGPRGGLITGNSWAILVSAPEGWVWDDASLRSQGVRGLFYKVGERFSPSKLYMYISPTDKTRGGPASLAEFIAADQAAYMSTGAGLRVRDLASYSPGMDYRFSMKEVDDEENRYYQTLAYFEGDDAFFVFVLSCRSGDERDREGRALRELLDTFTYISKE